MMLAILSPILTALLVLLVQRFFGDHDKLNRLETLMGNHMMHEFADVKERLAAIEKVLMGDKD